MQVIKRDELYARIWARPLTTVAAELGVTGTALKKTCLRHQIPTPPRGHWTRLKHGKPSPTPKLPAMKDPRLAQVRIVGDLEQRLPSAVLAAREAARQAPTVPMEVPAGDHPALLRTRKALTRARPDEEGFVTVVGKGILPSTLAPASIDRGIGWLSLLFQILELHGHGWRRTDEGLLLEVDGEVVGVSLVEQPDRTVHEPTPKELKLRAERQSWGYRADPWPKYDERPSGRLALVIAGNDWSGLRRTFADDKTQRLEAMLPDILGGLAAHAALTKANREKAEAAARARAEADVRRRAEAAFKEREKRRGEFVEAVARKLAERQRLVGVLAHLEGMGGEEIANRERCADFETFRPLFDAVQKDLNSGLRETRRFERKAEIATGRFYILGGQKAFVAAMDEPFTNENGNVDARLRVIFDNGTESNLLMRSFQKALQQDPSGRRVLEPEAGPLFASETDDGDEASGTIYVLRSKSNQPVVAANRDLVHKIGVTGGSVERRSGAAALDPTFLLAEVEIVATYELFNISRVKLENLIHRVFEPARLDIKIEDRFGRPVVPREWFLVPLFVIDEAVERIRDGSIRDYVYDSAAAALKRVS